MIRFNALVAAVGAAFALGTSSRAHADVDLWPLFESSDEGTTVLYPLYVHEGTFTMIFPLYMRTNEGQDHHVVWPFLKLSDGRIDRVAPIWYSDKSGEYTIFPLIHRSPEYTLTLIPPMYTAADGSQRTLFPVYSESREQDGDRVRTELDIFWPVYTRSQTLDGTGSILEQSRSFLFFSDSRTTGGKRTLRFLGIPFSERVE
jgi:hypothetical protein